MIRIIGALLISGGALSLGRGYIARQAAQRRCLHDLCILLRAFKAELSSRKPALPELCRRLKAGSRGSAERFLDQLCKELCKLGAESFPSLWAEAAEKSLTELSREELDSFRDLGLSLGRYTLDRQLEEISLCLSLLHSAEEDIDRRMPELRRLSMGLSLTAGLLLTIILA